MELTLRRRLKSSSGNIILKILNIWSRPISALKQIFVCKFLIAHVLFIQTTKSRNLMCIFPQTQELSLLELRNYFCWRRPTSIYVVSDQKLTSGTRGASVTDNMTATTAIKNTKYSVCLKVPSPFQNFTNFQKP